MQIGDDGFDGSTLAVLMSMPFGVYYCDRELIVKYINEYYAQYLGLHPSDIVGKKITEFIPDSRASAVMESGKEELYQEDSILSRKTNRKILVNRIPCRDRHGRVIGFISQLMSVGDEGWRALYDKIAHVEKSITSIATHTGKTINLADEIITRNEKMQKCIERAGFYAASDEPVLIYGQTGVGKELFARAIQRGSPRARRPFVCVNCASISREFINSELFGYAPGAFTGAHRQGKAGLMEKADGGTLFLDEIGDLPLDAQGALLRALETHQIQRINALESRKVDFRLITATNRDLQDMCNRHLYREDLFFRLSVLPLHIPPLCERTDDLPLLIEHFLNRMRGENAWSLSPQALEILRRYPWPGNVRELRNALAYAAVNTADGLIEPNCLPPHILKNDSPASSAAPRLPAAEEEQDEARSLPEKERLLAAMRQCGGNISCVARQLRLSRTTVYARLREYGIRRQKI